MKPYLPSICEVRVQNVFSVWFPRKGPIYAVEMGTVFFAVHICKAIHYPKRVDHWIVHSVREVPARRS